ncbi:hypothetical protein [Sinorhizobium medicae]|uniref:hypothetical protein n=2 Tax=Sinorhizobium medicae TaxID=110321 RepID=UPI000C79B64F|nr:hypothetical protein [Sinorhizobium medicae]PLU46578.1 hypothetical protein BMJ25_20015 [Sinorhizobium medicae]
MLNCIQYIIAAAFPAVFMIALIFIPNGVWKIGEKLKANQEINDAALLAREREVAKISSELVSKIRTRGGELDGAYQIEKIQKAIEYVIARHDWYESQRAVILGAVLTVSGLVFAGMAAYTAIDETKGTDPAKFVIASIGSTLLIGIIAIVNLYNKELDQDRSYRLIADIRHWFFRYSLPERINHYEGRHDVLNIANDVLREKEHFTNRILEVASLEQSLREDIEQLFILHVLIKHKSDSLQKMRWVFSSLILTLSFASVIFFIYYGFLM